MSRASMDSLGTPPYRAVPLHANTVTTASVVVEDRVAAGRAALGVRLSEEIEAHGRPGIDFVDQPTFAVVPVVVKNARVSVDILSRLRPSAPDFARGFAGLAFRINDDFSRFESVYLRPLNGSLESPPPERVGRAVQYFAYPDWPFDRLREQRPNAGYEAAADIGLDTWHTLEVDVVDDRVDAWVDGKKVLHTVGLAGARPGRLGLFVDIGTDATFSRLRVTPHSDRC